MLKRIATIFAGSVAHGAGTIVGVRAGHDAYNWVKYGGAKRTAKRIAGGMADAANALLVETVDTFEKEEPALRGVDTLDEEAADVRPVQNRGSVAALVQVECERCGRPAAVQLSSGDIIVTCAKCKARFWVDTDELAQRQERA
jgi:hypothetical protein